MSLLPIAFAAMSALQAPEAAAPPAAAPVAPGTIVVTGRRENDYRAALAACLARHCPPNEDIDATMALAESLYVDGQYREARTALRQSLSRNRGEARNYPEPVSDLYRANARVARALGLDRDATFSTWEILRALQAGIPAEDHRHFTARLEIAQSLIAFGQYDQAERLLQELARRAQAAGRDDVVAMAELRQVWISHLQAERGAPPPRRLLDMAQSPDPLRSNGARMLLVRIYSERGDTAAADRLIAELGRGGQRRQLLFSPPYELVQREDVEGNRTRLQSVQQAESGGLFTANLADRLVSNIEDKWIEVGFWVRPDGRVDGLEILRHRNDSNWAEPLLQSIRGRRYAPSDGNNSYRLERYTYTSTYEVQAGATHIATRSPRARVEYFDLTGDQQTQSQPQPQPQAQSRPTQ